MCLPGYFLSCFSFLKLKIGFKVNNNPGGVGSYFPYILLKEIQTMLSQLAKHSARVLPVDSCTDHAHYDKNHRLTVLKLGFEKKQKHGGPRRDYFLRLHFGNSQIWGFMSLFRHSVWFSFSVKQFPSAEFGICNIQLRIADKNRRRVELSNSVLLLPAQK